MTSLDSIAEKIHAARGARTHNLWMILTPSARNHSATADWELGCPALCSIGSGGVTSRGYWLTSRSSRSRSLVQWRSATGRHKDEASVMSKQLQTS